jgi:hypothetical protein
VTAAILLVNNCTETVWFQRAMGTVSVICFPQKRIRFDKPGKETDGPLQGQAFLYFGSEVSLFARVFGEFGQCVRRVEPLEAC